MWLAAFFAYLLGVWMVFFGEINNIQDELCYKWVFRSCCIDVYVLGPFLFVLTVLFICICCLFGVCLLFCGCFCLYYFVFFELFGVCILICIVFFKKDEIILNILARLLSYLCIL